MLVKSCRRMTGTFVPNNGNGNPIPYDNYVFVGERLATENERPNYLFGNPIQEVKIKVSDWEKVVKGNPSTLENKNVDFYFDIDKHFISIKVL